MIKPAYDSLPLNIKRHIAGLFSKGYLFDIDDIEVIEYYDKLTISEVLHICVGERNRLTKESNEIDNVIKSFYK